jgi:type II secretory pathway pseudopilin PulG
VRAHEAGFTYIGLLFAVVILGITLSTAGVVWSTQIRREREVQLLYAGDQIRTAIGRYHAAGGQYPQALADLVTDPRAPEVRRFLRRLYPDPMTNGTDWELIMAPEGGILGVASKSRDKPIKITGFAPIDVAFENTECYCDWRFIYSPRNQWRKPLPKAATQP